MAQRQLDPAEIRKQAITAQAKLWGDYCLFPIGGVCPRCRYDLAAYIPISKLQTEPITGCPKCHHSFVE